MIIDRLKHRQFIQDELKAQTDEFKKKLETSAIDLLLEKNEVFVAKFIKFMENGEMLLKLASSRPLPRKNDYLYCFTLPEQLKRYKDWGNLTYGDLIKKETQATEVKCVWHSTSDNPKFILAGFKGATEDFRKFVESAQGVVTLGPKVPPFEYLANLEKVTHSFHPRCAEILDSDYQDGFWTPKLLTSEDDMTKIVLDEYKSSNSIIVQGPPGTGKTHHIANLCLHICSQGHSVLVTALTNRALIEVANKLEDTLVANKLVYKTNLTTDEAKEVTGLQNAEKMSAIPGKLMLSTFYISSGYAAKNYEGPIFDYVIVDEASQAFLAMFAAANMLGHKNLWVGDVFQMPPIVLISKDRVKRLGYEKLINGLDSLTETNKYKTFQLSDTFRLGNRAANFTGLFYNNTLHSKVNSSLFKKDGPLVILENMPVGDPSPNAAIKNAVSIAEVILRNDEHKKIAILSHLVKTTQAIQKEVTKQLGTVNSVLVETVARVQGITRDVTIYVIPDTDSKIHSLELRLFNVATSRAKENTYIVCPNSIMNFSYMHPLVRKYFQKLLNDK